MLSAENCEPEQLRSISKNNRIYCCLHSIFALPLKFDNRAPFADANSRRHEQKIAYSPWVSRPDGKIWDPQDALGMEKQCSKPKDTDNEGARAVLIANFDNVSW